MKGLGALVKFAFRCIARLNWSPCSSTSLFVGVINPSDTSSNWCEHLNRSYNVKLTEFAGSFDDHWAAVEIALQLVHDLILRISTSTIQGSGQIRTDGNGLLWSVLLRVFGDLGHSFAVRCELCQKFVPGRFLVQNWSNLCSIVRMLIRECVTPT